jgi:hypothetical protein
MAGMVKGKIKKGYDLSKWELTLLFLCFFSCLMGAMLLPMDQCPDEAGRTLLSQWMVQNHTLPTGNEAETIIQGWGFSYALRPFLASIVGVLFQSFFALFTGNPTVLLAASRMCSVLSVTLCCWFCLRLGHICFSQRYSSFLFAAFVCFLPQVQFLGMYQNNDSLSLCAVSAMLYYLAEGFDNHWQVKSCVKLAVSLSVGALSYYSAYPWLLMGVVFFIISVALDRKIPKKISFILRRGGLMVGICLVMVGWFFVRNAMLHQGDFLGMVEEQRSRLYFMGQGYVLYDYVSAKAAGISFLSFLRKGDFWFIRQTVMSFFGKFGYMIFQMPCWLYLTYYFLTTAGVLNFFFSLHLKRPSRMNCFLAVAGSLAAVMTIAFHTWHSYARDFQPQGRYIITVALLLGFLIAQGIDTLQESRQRDNYFREIIPLLAGLIWVVLFVCTAVTTMSKMLL